MKVGISKELKGKGMEKSIEELKMLEQKEFS